MLIFNKLTEVLSGNALVNLFRRTVLISKKSEMNRSRVVGNCEKHIFRQTFFFFILQPGRVFTNLQPFPSNHFKETEIPLSCYVPASASFSKSESISNSCWFLPRIRRQHPYIFISVLMSTPTVLTTHVEIIFLKIICLCCSAQSLCWFAKLSRQFRHSNGQFTSVPLRRLRSDTRGDFFAGVFWGFLSRRILSHTTYNCTVSPPCERAGASSGFQPLKTSSHTWSSWKVSLLCGSAGGSPPF